MPPYPGGAAVDFASIVKTVSSRYGDRFGEIRVLTEKGADKCGLGSVVVDDVLLNYDSTDEKRFARQLYNYLMILAYILFFSKDVVHIHARYVYAGYIGRVVWLALMVSRAVAVIDIRDRFYRGFGFGAKFVVCSRGLLEYYSRLSGAEYVPVPLDLPEGTSKPGVRAVGYFGALTSGKGVAELIRGYELYRAESHDPLELHLYGPNAMGEGFIRDIERTEGASYMGTVPPGEAAERMSARRGVVLPSKSEGMPKVCLEAMALGRPVAFYRGIRELVPYADRRLVLDDITPEEIKRVLMEMENHSGEVSYEYDFSVHGPEQVAGAFVRIYSGLLAGEGRREKSASFDSPFVP